MYKVRIITEYDETSFRAFKTRYDALSAFWKLRQDPGNSSLTLYKLNYLGKKCVIKHWEYEDLDKITVFDILARRKFFNQLTAFVVSLSIFVSCILTVFSAVVPSKPQLSKAISDGTVTNLYIDAFPIPFSHLRTWDYKVEVQYDGEYYVYDIDQDTYTDLQIRNSDLMH